MWSIVFQDKFFCLRPFCVWLSYYKGKSFIALIFNDDNFGIYSMSSGR